MSEMKMDLITKFPWIELGILHSELPNRDGLVTSHRDNLVTVYSEVRNRDEFQLIGGMKSLMITTL